MLPAQLIFPLSLYFFHDTLPEGISERFPIAQALRISADNPDIDPIFPMESSNPVFIDLGLEPSYNVLEVLFLGNSRISWFRLLLVLDNRFGNGGDAEVYGFFARR